MKKGFTLLELLLVVSIIGILVIMFLVNQSGKLQKAEEVKNKTNEKVIEETFQKMSLEGEDVQPGTKVTEAEVMSKVDQTIKDLLQQKGEKNVNTEIQKTKDALYYIKKEQMRSYIKSFKDKSYVIVNDNNAVLNGYIFGISKDIHVISPDGTTDEIVGVRDDKVKSGNVTVYEVSNIDKVLEDVKTFNLNTVNVPVRIDIPNKTSSTFTINETQFTEAKALIKKLNENNIRVVIEPFPYINNGGISETEWNPSNINTFFWNWKTVVLQRIIDEVAVPENVYGIKIGSNMENMEYAEGYWSDTIDFVRPQYNGNVILHTNWWYTAEWDQPSKDAFQTKINYSYWKKLDMIAVDGWFEVSSKVNPTIDEIKAAIQKTDVWGRNQNVMAELKQFHEKTGKPIMFGGFNVPAKEKGMEYPWDPDQGGASSPTTQYNGLAAYRSLLENEDWFKGFSLWFIGSNDTNHSYAIKKEETKQLLFDWYKK